MAADERVQVAHLPAGLGRDQVALCDDLLTLAVAELEDCGARGSRPQAVGYGVPRQIDSANLALVSGDQHEFLDHARL